jgi:hypothetical protein
LTSETGPSYRLLEPLAIGDRSCIRPELSSLDHCLCDSNKLRYIREDRRCMADS